MKWILRYIKGSLSRILVYGGAMSDGESEVEGFVDSDYVGCMDTRQYLSGYVFTMFDTIICWKASLQKVIALSTTEV